MKIIVSTGDSHTWGQGVGGLAEYFIPPIINGDLRPVPFRFPCYTSLLRNYVTEKTGSSAYEYIPDKLINEECTVGENADFARVFIKHEGQNDIECINLHKNTSVEKDSARFVFDGTLTIIPDKNIHLYRVELYFGEYAVINAGVGSADTGLYLEKHYDRLVKEISPSFLVCEAHSINDWIHRTPLDVYRENLKKILTDCNIPSMLVTVSPIAESQFFEGSGLEYCEYIKASRDIAKKLGIPIADANAVMGTDKFDDIWHVNEKGHKIYFETIKEQLKTFGI